MDLNSCNWGLILVRHGPNEDGLTVLNAHTHTHTHTHNIQMNVNLLNTFEDATGGQAGSCWLARRVGQEGVQEGGHKE